MHQSWCCWCFPCHSLAAADWCLIPEGQSRKRGGDMTSGLEAGPIPTSKAAVSSRHKSPASATSAQQTAGNPSDKASLNPRKQRQELSTRRMNSATCQTSQSKENTKNAAENPRSPGKTPEMRPKMSSRSPGKHQECCRRCPGSHSTIQSSFVRETRSPLDNPILRPKKSRARSQDAPIAKRPPDDFTALRPP